MPDVLVFAALRPRLRGTPVILNIHDTFPELFATKFNRPVDGPWAGLIRAQERISSRFADAVVTVTPEAGEILKRRGSAPRGVNVVMNSPDETVFGPPRPPTPFPAEGPIRVIYHGGLAPRFGVELLIEAMGLLSPPPTASSSGSAEPDPTRSASPGSPKEARPGELSSPPPRSRSGRSLENSWRRIWASSRR